MKLYKVKISYPYCDDGDEIYGYFISKEKALDLIAEYVGIGPQQYNYLIEIEVLDE